VAGRSSEFAVRQAVGATPADVVALVLREGVMLAIAGTAAGVALALAGSRLLAGLLYEVSATDPVVYAAGATVLVCASIGALCPRRGGAPGPGIRGGLCAGCSIADAPIPLAPDARLDIFAGHGDHSPFADSCHDRLPAPSTLGRRDHRCRLHALP